MNGREFNNFRKFALAILLFGATTALLANAVFTYSSTQSERVIEDKTPKHLPIKIKVKPEKERAVKDLSNNRWHHDLAFEVRNTGDKPIYYLYYIVDMPEVKHNGISFTFIVRYGQRSIFSEWKGLARPEDKAILPGETVVLKIPDSQADGWDKTSEIERTGQPTKLSIIFQELNFGDGTGFWGTTGAAWPVDKRVSQAMLKVSKNRVANPNERKCNQTQADSASWVCST